jgi:metallo-beta-lactamase family protein
MESQHNFHGLKNEDATHKLKKFKINAKEDIYALSDDLAVLEFDENDVMQVLQQIESVPLKEKIAIIPGVLALTVYTAGHIEGATQSVWEVMGDGDEKKTFMYTGDIGRTRQPSLTGKPDLPTEVMDYVITEGTYSGRSHKDRDGEIQKIIHDVNQAKDICIIPTFALQRLQDVLSVLVEAVHKGTLKLNGGEKIYCHTPLGYILTKEYTLHDKEGRYKNLNDRDLIQWIERPEEVMALLKKPGRKIIMCSGGMLERGTVMQYIDKVNHNKDGSIILTGFQVPGTNGYKILHGEFDEPVYLNNKMVKSNSAYIGNYPLSGHADHAELLDYLTHLHYGKNAHVTIVHGGPARHTLAQDVKKAKPEITMNVPDENGITFEM